MSFLPPDDTPRSSMISRDSTALLNKPELDSHPSPQTPVHVPLAATQDETPAPEETKPQRRRRGLIFWLLGLAALVVIVLAVILPVYFTVIKNDNDNDNSNSGGSSGNGTPTSGSVPSATPTAATTGGDGSTVTLEDGSTFKYSNPHGGFWVADPQDPFSGAAKPNSWTPALNETWKWGENRVFGVNLGGWLVIEPFITPALFQKYPTAIDEWSLSVAMAADTAGGGLDQLEDHYRTFITEKDFAEIAGAGLNYVRIPIPFWAVDKWDGEPFLEKVCWKYILKAFAWARKYGLRVKLDLHTIPGSQNGYNHSGKNGQVGFLVGTMGMANAQRTLHYIRVITEFIAQKEYQDVVQIFGIMNEALITTIGTEQLTAFYREAHDMIRGITGLGEGNGPYISIHDGFLGVDTWAGFLAGSDRIILDRHPYTSFSGSTFDDPIATGTGDGAGGVWPATACAWADGFVAASTSFGVTIAGEWSNGYNDCGLFLTGVNGQQSYGGDCGVWQDASTWDDATKAGLAAFNQAQMDALKDWFFWTWKIGNSQAGHVESPLWSYQLGLEGGWISKDPRTAAGKCGGGTPTFDGAYQPYMTGGAGAGTITVTAGTPYPPAQLNMANVPVSELPQYTATASVVPLPGPSIKGFEVDGWYDADDKTLAPTTIPGCDYPDAWDGVNAAVPTGCGTGTTSAPTGTTTTTTTDDDE